jgi:hypothetical protein
VMFVPIMDRLSFIVSATFAILYFVCSSAS